MIQYITLPMSVLLLVVLQHSVPGVLFFNSITVEISLIVVIYAGFRFDIIKGAVLTVVMGFIMDCITGAISGFYTLIYFFLFSFSFLVSPRVYAESSGIIALMTFFSGLLEGLLIIILNYLIYGTHMFYDTFRFFIPQLIVVSAISPFLFKFFDKFGFFYGGYARSARRR
jgi:hypothetical protein